MCEKLYYKDSFIKEFNATVVSCDKVEKGYAVVLNKTAFFPEGGGQTSDDGFLNDVQVFDVQIKGDNIIHYTKSPLISGQEVYGSINWEKRFDFMQQHSGEHIVSGIAHRLYGCENVGFHLSCDIVTLDFDIPLSKAQISEIEALANQAVYNNTKINTFFPNENQLAELTYRSKKEIEGELRIVEIVDVDMCACCAPHVNTTGEIGIIKLMDSEALRGGVRIEFKCGKRALEDYVSKYENTAKISSMLCVKKDETACAVDKLLTGANELKSKLTDMRRTIISLKAESFSPNNNITLIFENELSIKDLQLYADALYKKAKGIRGVLSKAENGYSFAICGDEKELTCFFNGFRQRFSVKGGGRGTMVQGTVLSDKESIENYITEAENE